MPHSKNFLLNRLDASIRDRLSPHLVVSQLAMGEVLAETHARVEKVYFPHSGVISCVVETVGGGAIETGMIGKDVFRRGVWTPIGAGVTVTTSIKPRL